MNALKAKIADKVLEISSINSDSTKASLEQLSRFRDFVNSSKSLIERYPAIEAELIRLLDENKFDIRLASSKVDEIMKYYEEGKEVIRNSFQYNFVDPNNILDPQIINAQQEILENQILESDLDPLSEEKKEDSDIEIQNESLNEEKERCAILTSSVDAEMKEYRTSDLDLEFPTEGQSRDDIEIEEINDSLGEEVDNNLSQSENVVKIDELEVIAKTEEGSSVTEDISNRHSQKDTIIKVLQVLGIAIAVVALIFIIRFVVYNWQTILLVLGVALVVALIVYFLIKKSRPKK